MECDRDSEPQSFCLTPVLGTFVTMMFANSPPVPSRRRSVASNWSSDETDPGLPSRWCTKVAP